MMRKKVLSVLLVMTMLCTFAPVYVFAGTDDYPSKLKNAAKDSLVDDWRFYNRECTSFVAWRLNSRNGIEFTNWYGGVHWGNADNWGAAAKSLGITVDNTPAIGAVAWWNSMHVAWVEAVDGNNVTIEEYNNPAGSGNYRERTILASNPTGYIHIKDLDPNPTPTPKREGLELGDSGDDVKKLQETLNGMTGTSLNADGSYGSNTENAVKEYQQKKGLTVDGWYGPNTKAALEDEVRTMQNMLNAVTGTSLNADGWYGPNTKKAVIAYQQKKGLSADGWYGPKTKAALEADYKNLTSPSSPTPTPAPATMPSESNKSETFKEPATGGGTSEITAPASFHFAKKTSYTQGQFTDVPASQWYTDNVASAFETGLMVGKSDTTFSPFADVTIAEAITMAARVHSIYTTGMENFVRSDTWYQPYLDYAYQNGIINEGYYNCDVTQKANRAQFAEIFANSLPGEALPAINSIADNAIPDVKTGSQYADYVYKLYRAGILAGGDASGTFSPDTYITRAEAASIVSRLGDTDFRVSFSLN